MPENKLRVSVQRVTPRRAQQILDGNTHNRRVRDALVEDYARDMAAGRWDVNGETIKISDQGILLDGQHRLTAVIKANVIVDMLVVENLPEIVQETVDTGSKRTVADVLSLRGEISTTVLAAIARKVMVFARTGNKDVQMSYNRPTTLEVAEAIDQYPFIREAAHFGLTNRRSVSIGPSVLGFAYWACSMRDETDAELFFEGVVTGADLSHGDPALTLRNKLTEKRAATRGGLDEREILAYFFRAWNAYREGRKLVLLKFGKNESFPVPK